MFQVTFVQSTTDKENLTPLRYKDPEAFIKAFLKGIKIIEGRKEGQALVGAIIADGQRLEEKNVTAATALILDVDGKTRQGGVLMQDRIDPEEIYKALPYRGIAYTSYNHTEEFPRFRVILPLAEQVSPAEFRRLWVWAYAQTDQKLDPACKNPGRLYYLPRCPVGQKAGRWIRELPGPFLSLRDVPADFVVDDGPAPKATPKGYRPGVHFADRDTQDSRALIGALMESKIYQWAREHAHEISREVWRGLATNLAAIAVEDTTAEEAAREAFHELSLPDTDRYNRRVTDRTFTDAMKSAKDHGPMTHKTLVANGLPEELCSPEDKTPLVTARRARTSKKAAPPTEEAPTEKVFDLEDTSRYVYVMDIGWFIKNTKARWMGPYTDTAFTAYLLGEGLPKKAHDAFRAELRVCHSMEPLYGSTADIEERDGEVIFNSYLPPEIKPIAGDCSDILALVHNLCGGDHGAADYFLDWLAGPVRAVWDRMPPKKMGTAVVLQGDQGSGKGTLSLVMEAIYGTHNFIEIGQDALDGKFNDELMHKLFVVANEVMSTNNRSAETANKLKPWITDPHIPIEQKFKGRRLVRNNFNIIFTSNDERPVIIEKTDRRFSVFRSSTLDKEIARRIHDDLHRDKLMVSAFFHFLISRTAKIGFGDMYTTEAKTKVVDASASSEEKFVKAIEEDGWVSVAKTWMDDAHPDKPRVPYVDAGVPSATLQAVYQDFCRRNGLRATSMLRLGSALKERIPKAVNDRTVLDGTRVRVWTNIPYLPPGEVVQMPRKQSINVPAGDVDDVTY